MQEQDINFVKISEKVINNPINSMETITSFGSENGETFGIVLGALIVLVIFIGLFLFIYSRFIKK